MTDPLAYASTQLNRRPSHLLVLGIIGIIYAAGGLLGSLGGVLQAMLQISSPGQTMRLPVAAVIATLVSNGVSIVLSAFLLWASIASLKFKPNCRGLFKGWAIAYLAWLGVQLILQVLIIVPAMREMFMSLSTNITTSTTNPNVITATQRMPTMFSWAMYAGLAINAVIQLVFPIAVLIVLRATRARFGSPVAMQ